MFENIEKARHLLSSGSTRAAVDEFFRLIQVFIEKDNHEEASRLMLEIAEAVVTKNDSKVLIQTVNYFIDTCDKMDCTEVESFQAGAEDFFEKASIVFQSRENRYDMVGKINEAIANQYEKLGKDPKEKQLEAAKAYSENAIQILSKARVRADEEKIGNEYLEKAKVLYKKADYEIGSIDFYTSLSQRYIKAEQAELGEKTLDQAVNLLLEMKTDNKESIIEAAEKVMDNFVIHIETLIPEILDPENQILKSDAVNFDNSTAIRLIKHAKDICISRDAIPAITVLARELALMGLAIFEKNLHREAIPYYNMAKEYYIEIGNNDNTIEFGNNIISLGLQLHTMEQYPVGRDYFNIAIEIGRSIDRNFEVEVYKKEADLLLKYNKFQLASETFRKMIDPLKELPESNERMDIPSQIRQVAQERFSKNDFHYAEIMYRLTADFFTELGQIELAADTLDSSWPPMFKVRNLQTGIDLATKAAEAYIEAGKNEDAADVYLKLAEELLVEGHFDIALDRLKLAAQTIPPELQEQKFKPLVLLSTKYSEQCIKSGDIINAKELWSAACDFNETLSRSLIKRNINTAVETIEDHISYVRKFDIEELNDITLASARGSGKVLSEAGEYERAAKIMVSFAADFLRKNLTDYADPLFEEGAVEFTKANQPEEAARILSALARYHSEHDNHEKSLNYYLLASVKNKIPEKAEIYPGVANHCFETYTTILNNGDFVNAEKGYQVAIQIDGAVSTEAEAGRSYEVAKKFLAKEQYDFALKYYSKSIDSYLSSSIRHAAIVGAEIVEKGRDLFQKDMLPQANDTITLGIETLNKADQTIQAAQTARIEGEKFLKSHSPKFGLVLLDRATTLLAILDDRLSIADIHSSMAEYHIINNNLEEGLIKIKDTGDIYLSLNKNKELVKLITQIVDIATEIVLGSIPSIKLAEGVRATRSQEFFQLAESFALQINDLKLNGDIKIKEWEIYSKENLHEAALISLEKTYKVYIQGQNMKQISQLANKAAKFSNNLIAQNNLLPATNYLNHSIEVLRNVSKHIEAAGICINTCEGFLKRKNNEVAVSWGIRGAEILTEIDRVEEAIQFLEELVDQLMAVQSIENAILCYGKIAKILEHNNRLKEVEETALKVMAFGTANIKSNNPEAGLRLWEVALTIGAIVGEEFTGRLCMIEGQTFYEIKDYEKSIELFKESYSLFRRTGKNNRLIHLGNTIFKIALDLQKSREYDTAFKMLPIAFEAMTSADNLFLGTEKLITHAKNYIEVERAKEGFHLINTAIDALFAKEEITGGVEKCFVGAALLISYGRNVGGSRLIDKGMEKIAQITDETSIKHLATVCRNQGIILREDGKLEASHVILASGIGILRTINDKVGIGQISIDLGRTLVQRNEMAAAVEAFYNGVQLLAQDGLAKESLDIVNELIAEGRKQIDNNNLTTGMPLVELAGGLYIFLQRPERIMVISEIFINQGGKMLNERNFDIAALYFSKAMELSTRAGLNDYLPKVGNRCIDFGLKLIKEGDPILGIQFMNAGGELIVQYETKFEKAGRAGTNYLETISQVIGPEYEKSIEDEEDRLELIGQFIDSTTKFLSQTKNQKGLENLTKILTDYGKKLLVSRGPRVARGILDSALAAADLANNAKLKIDIANNYLNHVNYLIENNKLEFLDATVNQARSIYLEVNDIKEIRKFIGTLAQTGRILCNESSTRNDGMKLLSTITNLVTNLKEKEFYSVITFPLIQLNQDITDEANIDLVIFSRENIIKLFSSIINANHPLSILGNLDFANMIIAWHQTAELLLQKAATFDQAIRIEDQALRLAITSNQPQIAITIIDELLVMLDSLTKKRFKGLDVLMETLATTMNSLGQRDRILEIGKQCVALGQQAADKKKLSDAINFLKAAGRIYEIYGDNRLIAEVAMISASIGDQKIKEDKFKEGLYYYSTSLENYELSQDENSIQIIATTIQNLFNTAPVEDGYICYLVPGMVYANRDKIEEAEDLAYQALDHTKKMLESGKKDLIFHSIPYLFAATDIYERTGNFIEETKIYDDLMFSYLKATSDSKIVNLFLDLLIRSSLKKLRIWDFNAIQAIFEKVEDQRVLKNKKFVALKKSLNAFQNGDLSLTLKQANLVNIKFQRNLLEFMEIYKEQILTDITERGRISIYEYMEKQPISRLINVLIQDLYARKEITGKYFKIGLFVSSGELSEVLQWCDKELLDNGKAVVADLANKTKLRLDEILSVIRIEYLPQKFMAVFNQDTTVLYSYLQLRSEVAKLALGYQDIGNIDINKVSTQVNFPPETIQREIEYLILEGKINPRIVGRK
ncbi:MAG: hypothetical protein ACTSQK_04195 [Candidatus Heimdallarchaeota archaeon]